eukprot:8154027-Lingulodinium_polyedra.AAC.1
MRRDQRRLGCRRGAASFFLWSAWPCKGSRFPTRTMSTPELLPARRSWRWQATPLMRDRCAQASS